MFSKINYILIGCRKAVYQFYQNKKKKKAPEAKS